MKGRKRASKNMVVTFTNEKGGIGKTSVPFHMGWYLATLGKKILYVDMDAQRANLSFVLNLKNKDDLKTIRDVIQDEVPIEDVVVDINDNISIVPANYRVKELNENDKISTFVKEIREIEKNYDFVFIDVNPTPGQTHILAMAASDYIVCPTLPDVSCLEAMLGVLETYTWVKQNANKKLRILGFIFNVADKNSLSSEVYRIAKSRAEKFDTCVFDAKIRRNVDISKAVSAHVGVTEYAPKSNGAADYKAVTAEFLARIM